MPDAPKPADTPEPADDHRHGDEVHDELPEDLDAAGYVGPYTFPNNNRRRTAGYLYLLVGAACVVAWAVTRGHEPVLVNSGFLAAGIALLAIGGYCQLAGWNLDIDERDALVITGRTVGFAIGHASAQLAWRGWRSRPTWRILFYSAEDQPEWRGLAMIDGVDGQVIEWFTEPNPEDWSEYR